MKPIVSMNVIQNLQYEIGDDEGVRIHGFAKLKINSLQVHVERDFLNRRYSRVGNE
jgi:hypothetical protein